MIRALAADELHWFLTSYYTFVGHNAPRAFAKLAVKGLRDHDREAARSFVMFAAGDDPLPVAGVHMIAPDPEDDDQNLHLSNIWYRHKPQDLTELVSSLLRKHPHDAVRCPLYNFTPDLIAQVAPAFETLGFTLQEAVDLEFELADVPPLGMPLVLEAYTEDQERVFREAYTAAEGERPSERFWSWLKRWRGKFIPDLWFIARETLDQDPVGYAFYGMHHDGVDGAYYLTEAGVLAQYRDSSEMLRRLVITSMLELAARSPLGQIKTTITHKDPKLVRIFELLGFVTENTYTVLVKEPT